MGIFDRMMDAMNLDNDDDEFIDDDVYGYEEEEEPPRSGLFSRRGHEEDEAEEEEPPVRQRPAVRQAKVTPMRSRRQTPARSGHMEVCVIKPTQFDDSREVIETLLTGRPVILNMEGLDLGLAQRIIDVTSGACLAIDGALQKISNYIFILTPSSVDISGDLQGIMDAFDLSGLQAGF